MSLRSFAVRGINIFLGRADVVDVTNAIGTSGRRVGHVKAWGCTGKRYTTGDRVPHLRNRSTYSIPTVEGWWVNCAHGRIASWSGKPVMDTSADLYGRVHIAVARPRR